MRRRNQRAFGRVGAVTVETAIVISTFILFMYGVLEYGRLTMARHLLDNAAREGARQAVVNTEEMTTADIQNTVSYYLSIPSLTNVNTSVFKADPVTQANLGAWTDAAFNDCIAVQVTADYTPILPVPGLSGTQTLKTIAIMTCEGN